MAIYVNEYRIRPTLFPDKTSQVWDTGIFKGKNDPFFLIKWYYENEAELMHLAQLCDLIKSGGGIMHLDVPFLPYGRQDKEVTDSSCFSLHTFAKLIDFMGFESIQTIDAHNNNIQKFFQTRVIDTFPIKPISFASREFKPFYVAYPDIGAADRYSKKINNYIYKPCILFSKTRCESTGQLIGVSMDLERDLSGKRVLIVDDICDGGATFEAASNALYLSGASSVGLYVTHGIFSRGFDGLRESGIKNIYTSNGEVKF